MIRPRKDCVCEKEAEKVEESSEEKDAGHEPDWVEEDWRLRYLVEELLGNRGDTRDEPEGQFSSRAQDWEGRTQQEEDYAGKPGGAVFVVAQDKWGSLPSCPGQEQEEQERTGREIGSKIAGIIV